MAQGSMRGDPVRPVWQSLGRALLGLFDLPLHGGSHFTLTGSGIVEE